jgi:hypothetical protein
MSRKNIWELVWLRNENGCELVKAQVVGKSEKKKASMKLEPKCVFDPRTRSELSALLSNHREIFARKTPHHNETGA